MSALFTPAGPSIPRSSATQLGSAWGSFTGSPWRQPPPPAFTGPSLRARLGTTWALRCMPAPGLSGGGGVEAKGDGVGQSLVFVVARLDVSSSKRKNSKVCGRAAVYAGDGGKQMFGPQLNLGAFPGFS